MLKSPKHWDFLAGAFVLMGAAIVLTLIRWCYLVRAMGIPLSMKDAMRIGFLGYWFNLAPVGIVGGDLVKAVMLAHEHPGNKRQVAGLGASSIGWSGSTSCSSWPRQESCSPASIGRTPLAGVHVTCQITLLLTLVGTVGHCRGSGQPGAGKPLGPRPDPLAAASARQWAA